MRYAHLIVAFAASALALPASTTKEVKELFTIELEGGERRQVTEAEKFALKAEGKSFFDVTYWPDFTSSIQKRQAVTYPSTLTQGTSVRALNAKLSSANIQSNLQTFSTYNNRYYRATTGKQSSDWLLSKVQSYIPAGSKATVKAYTHSWTQNSIIATIPGKSTKTIVVGAHLDSVNGASPTSGRAPGADDNGSGSTTILEAFRTLLTNTTIASGGAAQTIEFHWYAGEEAGLLGSQEIFNSYSSARNILAMLNQDMTGYTAGYTSRGLTPKFGVITDNVSASLTTFTKRVITAYTTTAYVDDRCGYACSDHASANRVGFPSAMIYESEMAYENPYIHTASDTLDRLDFAHMLEHARLVVGWVVELGFVTL
ncbi:transferrin receptor [Bimuria novae-zelandiae CBS 107.79]|uniref:Peptide hydrolase n=1 Tax=Bimuria novae-zelandiae CBS 107.79 TaxID=1447943 RepID=A0A6A5V0B3_9PLEO|nr:transferrin receptor [Bimuria novae-zelandiae CBS 107.79]